jgi:nucleoside-diphosphate-sugar epimerase
MGISSTSVYGKQQYGLLSEEIEPKPDNFRGEIILKYEHRIESEIDVQINILRFAGLYDPKEKTPEFHNKLSRNTASNIIEHFIHSKKSGLFNCLEDNDLISNGRNIINDKLKNSGFNF